jgi:[protein-PII] uridylyltransferase
VVNVLKPREIIDRKAITMQLNDLVDLSGYGPKTQTLVLAIFKAAQKAGWSEIKRRFEDTDISVRQTTLANSYLIDQLIRLINEFACTRVYPSANPATSEQMSLIATGGYGRAEVAPYSDVDLMFLFPYKLTAHSEQIIEYILYTLWDLGLKVGHATRSVEEAIRLSKENMTIRTSLLESRWLQGNSDLFNRFKIRFSSEVVASTGPDFVDAKLTERDTRHERMGDTRYVLEPNLKEGKGGFRDLQTLFWIAKYLYQVEHVQDLMDVGVLTPNDVKLFKKAATFLWTARCHVHYIAGRPEERLTFNVQSEIAERMGYKNRAGTQGVERFMKHYFLIAKDIGDLTRVLCAVLEEQHKKRRTLNWLPIFQFRKKEIVGFQIDGGRLNLRSESDLKKAPIKILKLFRLMQKHKLDVHPKALRLVSQNLNLINAKMRKDPEANAIFMEILTGQKPEHALMMLNEAGVFGRFMPDFGRVVAQMQYDMYHVYTVDEHTIRAIGIVNGIETGRLIDDHPVACAVISEVQSRETLFLSVLLHDIAKGRGGDHSVLGAEVAEKLGPQLGLSEWETETVAWLVRNHLLMSNTAFKRDLDDPKTISDFLEIVQSPERLRLLLILTVADIRAVGPNVWNSWKAGLLRELYLRAQEVMSDGAPALLRSERVEQAKQELAVALSGWSENAIAEHLELGNPGYWLGVGLETQVCHAVLIRKTEKAKSGFAIEFGTDEVRNATEITVYSPDHPGLFSAIAGAMALCGASIIDAKVQTLNNGMALDSFWIYDNEGTAYRNPRDLKRLHERVEDAIQGKIRPSIELEKAQKSALPNRTRVFKVAPRVLIDNKASRNHTVIEINSRDRPALLHDVTTSITYNGLQISSAHISTYGERVVDVFYVKDVFGLKIDSERKINTVRIALMEAIGGEAAKLKNLKIVARRKKTIKLPEVVKS